VGDFRLFGSRALDALRSMRGQHRFLRGMAVWTGFREVILPFERPARAAGLLGEYVARNYEEGKCRPLYLVSRTVHAQEAHPQPGLAAKAGSPGGPPYRS
jgi:hypothetical protein